MTNKYSSTRGKDKWLKKLVEVSNKHGAFLAALGFPQNPIGRKLLIANLEHTPKSEHSYIIVAVTGLEYRKGRLYLRLAHNAHYRSVYFAIDEHIDSGSELASLEWWARPRNEEGSDADLPVFIHLE
jgi:hypothetical protein